MMMRRMTNKVLGVIVSVDGNISQVGMYKMSNDSEFIWNGDILVGPKVGAMLTILQNDIKIIAKVINEKIIDQQNSVNSQEFDNRYHKDSVNRIISLKTQGVIEGSQFKVTSSYVPMIGNEVTVTSKEDIDLIYGIKNNDKCIPIGKTIFENKRLNIPVNELFASHIGIFGNTGSGKSNTLHKLYFNLFNSEFREGIFEKSQFFVFDFNGEYRGDYIFGLNDDHRKIINLNTRDVSTSDKIYLDKNTFLDSDILVMLFDAKKGVQAPFIRRTIKKYKELRTNKDIARLEVGLLKYILENMKHLTPEIKDDWIDTLKIYVLKYCPNEKYTYEKEVLEKVDDLANLFIKTTGNLDASKAKYFSDDRFYNNGIFSKEANDLFTNLSDLTAICLDKCSVFERLKAFLAFQLVYVSTNKNNLDYLNPLFDRILNVLDNLEDIIQVENKDKIRQFYKTVNIISFLQCNLTVKRIIPMLIAKMIYNNQKLYVTKDSTIKHTTHLIIDEAHNILGTLSNNSDYWQNKRLSSFEEIIKEGRKFGFYLTIASQRPADISPTIMSQIHNFFIHRLVNDNDLKMIENTMPTLDHASFQMIPSLGQGETVLTGKAFPISIFAKIDQVAKEYRPKSEDIRLTDIWSS